MKLAAILSLCITLSGCINESKEDFLKRCMKDGHTEATCEKHWEEIN